MDVIVSYENQGVPNTASLVAMTDGVAANHFAVIAYGVNVWNGSSVSNIFNYASYVYVTNETLPNPYGALTGDFSKLVALLGPQTSVPLTVNSVNAAGTPIAGLFTVIKSTNGSAVGSGYTPLTLSVPSGAGYVVSIANYGSFVFNHWNDGTLTPTKTLTMTQGTTLTASYSSTLATTVTMTIQSATLVGAQINGLSATVTSNGNIVKTGLTPLTFTATVGTQYMVSIGNSGGYVLDHWDDGTTTPARPAMLTQNATITPYFGPTATSTATTTATTPATTTTAPTVTKTITATTTATITATIAATTTVTTTATVTTTSTQSIVTTSSSTTNTLNTNTFTISTLPSQSSVGGFPGVQIGYTNTYNTPISAFVWVVARDTAGHAVGVFVGSVTVDSHGSWFVPTLNLPAGNYDLNHL
jgi:hypothetical protein